MDAELLLGRDQAAATVFWSLATLGSYVAARLLARLRNAWWTSPLIVAPALLLALAIGLHATYHDYFRATRWLVAMLGPVTVAFALPIYQQRALIKKHWPVLLVGVFVGSASAMASAWGLAGLLGVPGDMRLSLMPRSISTPFAMTVSGDIGGAPELTAVFVVMTGVVGAAVGEALIKLIPLRSSLARGALFGMGAHGSGAAKARLIGNEEGSVAGLVMVLAGVLNVAVAPLLPLVLH